MRHVSRVMTFALASIVPWLRIDFQLTQAPTRTPLCGGTPATGVILEFLIDILRSRGLVEHCHRASAMTYLPLSAHQGRGEVFAGDVHDTPPSVGGRTGRIGILLLVYVGVARGADDTEDDAEVLTTSNGDTEHEAALDVVATELRRAVLGLSTSSACRLHRR
jgi:hypothetical protein